MALIDWFPDRPPTWSEVGSAGFGVLSVLTMIPMQRPISPSWLVVGFVTATIGLGPVAQSSAGAWIGNWFRGIGEAGRAVAIVVFVLTLWGTVFALEPPISVLASTIAGAVAALALYVIVFVVLSGSIEGWTTPQDGS